MNTREVLDIFAKHPALPNLAAFLESNKKGSVLLDGLVGSAIAFPLSIVSHQYQILIITADEDTASFLKSDLESLL